MAPIVRTAVSRAQSRSLGILLRVWFRQGVAQECQDRSFLRLQAARRAIELRLCSPLQRLPQRTVQVPLEDSRMDVTFAADRWRVAEHLGDGLDCLQDILLGRC